jgi:hypothetical protein
MQEFYLTTGTKVRAIGNLMTSDGKTQVISIGELLTVERELEGGHLHFQEEGKSRSRGWPSKYFIPDGMYLCPICHNASSEVYRDESRSFTWENGHWIVKDVNSDTFTCPICEEGFDADILETYGMSPAPDNN